MMKKNLRKVFPDHWSFMLGEVALWSFVVLLLSGVFLTFWYVPSMGEVHYGGSYDPLRGVEMSEAYASTLKLSFDVRGGLLMRQMHHWAAMLFIAAMMIHLLRVYFTGAHRKPRELNWVIGCLLLLLGTLEGFTGYSLPDDLLSGTGIRAADGFMKATPVVGSYMSFFLFGGEFPGDSIIPRLYTDPRAADPRPAAGPDHRAHAAARLPQAHAVAWPRTHRAERGRLPDAAGLRRQGRRVLLHRLRRHRADGRPDDDQPGVVVRSLRPVQGHGRLPTGLVHGLAGRAATDHAGAREPYLRPHDLVERDGPDPDPASADADDPDHAAVPRVVDHRRQARPPPVAAAAQRAHAHRGDGLPDDVLRAVLGCRRQRPDRDQASTCRSTRSPTSCGWRSSSAR